MVVGHDGGVGVHSLQLFGTFCTAMNDRGGAEARMAATVELLHERYCVYFSRVSVVARAPPALYPALYKTLLVWACSSCPIKLAKWGACGARRGSLFYARPPGNYGTCRPTNGSTSRSPGAIKRNQCLDKKPVVNDAGRGSHRRAPRRSPTAESIRPLIACGPRAIMVR